jgi:hypothetical protein
MNEGEEEEDRGPHLLGVSTHYIDEEREETPTEDQDTEQTVGEGKQNQKINEEELPIFTPFEKAEEEGEETSTENQDEGQTGDNQIL